MAGLSGMAVGGATALLERESELADLAREAAAARSASGRLVLVEGPAEIGKTALLAAARSLAQAAGMAVARARGTELESGFAFGVVRQLFEPLLRARSEGEQARLLSGPASLAGRVLGAGDRAAVSVGERLPEVMHGLYWLTVNLAERGPLLVLIDDAHWADVPSLRFLSYLAGRLEGVALLAVVAARPTDRGPTPSDALTVISRESAARLMRLGPLSAVATVKLVEREYGEEAAPEFARACHRSTGGNPFLLGELVRALRADGIAPTAADAPRVAQQRPASVARSVLTRIASLSSTAAAAARALAALGGEAALRDLAELSSLDAATLDEAVDLLARAEIVVGPDPVAFVHPIVHASIYSDIPVGERGRAHLRAGRLLAAGGAAAERVAAHLLQTPPAGDEWTVGMLGRAAREALARGAPDGAVTYLIRALAEPPATRDRQPLLALLGRSEYLAHQPGAATRLLEAMAGARTPPERGELALQAAKALIMGEPDRSEDAVTILDRAIAGLGERDSQLSMRLQAQLLAAAALKLSTWPLHRERLDAVYPMRLGDGPAERLLLASLAEWTLTAGSVPGRFPDLARHAGGDGPPAEVARRVAERAIAGGALLREEGSDSELFYLPIFTLIHADCLDCAAHWLGETIADAQKHGSLVGYAQASALRAEAAYRCGDLAIAEAHAHAAAAVSVGDALAVLINVMLDQGRLDETQRLLERYPLPPQSDHLMLQPIRAAAARLDTTQGRTREAADQLLACGTWLDTWGAKNPSVVSWRSSAALALHQLSEPDRARELASEEVALARPLGHGH